MIPVPLQYVTLILDLIDGSGATLAAGSATLVPSAELTGAADNVRVPQAPVRAAFRGGPFPQVQLLATDNPDLIPGGWGWSISFPGVPGDPGSFSFFLPYAGGALQYLSGLAPVSPAVPMAAYLPLSGGTMAGPLTLAADPAGALEPATKQYADAHGGDKTYTQPFTSASTIAVTHNLGKYPSVSVTDSALDEVEGDVQYLSTSSLTVTFSAPFSGTVYCN